MKKIIAGLVWLMITAASASLAAAEADTARISKTLETRLKVTVSDIHPAEIEGLYEAITDRGVIYISGDGRYIFSGSIYDLDNGMANLTEKTLARLRQAELSEFQDSMIVFPAEQEKYRVTVFTDISCGYCRKLHSQMDDYNRQGITIQYLAFPRGGLQSEAYRQMQAVWCAEDPRQALTEAKQGKTIPSKACDDKVAEQYQLGVKFGVQGTPAVVLADGTMIPGYRPPEAMAQLLAQHSS